MKILLDTNIIIHRETDKIVNNDIGKLFHWLDKIKAQKYIHPVTKNEINKLKNKNIKTTFNIKLESYTELKTLSKIEPKIQEISNQYDKDDNDKNDSILLNEVYSGSVDFLITEDKKIHSKAKAAGISEKVFTIEQFIEKQATENPDLLEYKVLSVSKSYFGTENISDSFFDSFKEDYPEFEKWFRKKSNEPVYISKNENNKIVAFLYLKVEHQNENYADIEPTFTPKKRLKIGTFKVELNGFRLGERFLKIIFDNAIKQNVEEIYVTIFEKRDEQKRLIRLLEDWGFKIFGKKRSTGELVMVRDFSKKFDINDPKLTYPYIGFNNNRIFIVSIYPEYHTELFPDSILRTESPDDFREDKPHRNAISKVYISRSIQRDVYKGDILLFYRTAEKDKPAYYSSLITTIGIVEEKIENIQNEKEFIEKCRKRSVFTDDELKNRWNYSYDKPFIINFLHVYSLNTTERSKLIRKNLLDLNILTGEKNELRGLKEISTEQFKTIIKKAQIHESFIVY